MSDSIVDDALSAASGIRQAAKWFASALAAIPALGIVGSLIKGPGTAGYDVLLLFFGILMGGTGAYLGIYFFSRVFMPVPLEDNAVPATVDLTRLPGQPYKTYQELITALEDARYAYNRDQYRSEKARLRSAIATQAAADAEVNAQRLETAASRDKTNALLKRQAEEARHEADQNRALASSRSAAAAAADQQAAIWANQVSGIEKIRTQLFHLVASDNVAQRFRRAQQAAIVAAVLVGLGVLLLAVAPRQATPGASESTVNLRVTLEPSLSPTP